MLQGMHAMCKNGSGSLTIVGPCSTVSNRLSMQINATHEHILLIMQRPKGSSIIVNIIKSVQSVVFFCDHPPSQKRTLEMLFFIGPVLKCNAA